MKKFLELTLIAGALVMCTNGFGQFSMSGQIRPRTEYRHGFQGLPVTNQEAGAFIDQRTRLNLGYKSEGYNVFIAMQDIRTWGSTSQLNLTDGFTSIHEAYGVVKLSPKIGLKLGRQEILYDDDRIFGNVEWAQQARSHDAAVFLFQIDSSFTIHVGGAYNQDKNQNTTTFYSVPKSYKSLQYMWLHKDFSSNFGASVLFLNNGLQPSFVDAAGVTHYKDNYSQTIGTRLTYGKNKLAVNGAYYTTTGVDGDWANSRLSAMLASIDLSYKITEKFSATLGYEFISGQSQTDTTVAYTAKNHAFNPFYGTNHKFNGLMDNFYVGNHINNVGLSDLFLELKVKGEKGFISATTHMFSAAADVLDVTELTTNGNIRAMASGLGTEIDLYGGFALAKGVNMQLGYSHLLGTATLEAITGGDRNETSNWAWIMVTMKPQFIGGK